MFSVIPTSSLHSFPSFSRHLTLRKCFIAVFFFLFSPLSTCTLFLFFPFFLLLFFYSFHYIYLLRCFSGRFLAPLRGLFPLKCRVGRCGRQRSTPDNDRGAGSLSTRLKDLVGGKRRKRAISLPYPHRVKMGHQLIAFCTEHHHR